MPELSNTRLFIHAAVPVCMATYLVWLKVSFLELFITVFLTVFIDLVFLSSIVIRNMNVKPATLLLIKKNVVITGGSSGIGFSIAKQLVAEGCKNIILIARNESRLTTSVKELATMKSEEQQISYISLDLKDAENVKCKIDLLLSRIKRIDILINCAGFSIPGEFLHSAVKDFEEMVNTNYLSSVYISHSVAPYMVKEKFGQIVFLSSVGGQLPIAGFSAYSPSKYAIRGFAEILQSELRTYGIGVTLAFPPDTNTPGYAEELKRKPKITQIMSEQVGLWESDVVAKSIIGGIKGRKFMIGFGSDGYFVNAFTGGAAPASTTLEFWANCLLSPIIRIYYLIFMQNFFTNVINDEHRKKNE